MLVISKGTNSCWTPFARTNTCYANYFLYKSNISFTIAGSYLLWKIRNKLLCFPWMIDLWKNGMQHINFTDLLKNYNQIIWYCFSLKYKMYKWQRWFLASLTNLDISKYYQMCIFSVLWVKKFLDIALSPMFVFVLTGTRISVLFLCIYASVSSTMLLSGRSLRVAFRWGKLNWIALNWKLLSAMLNTAGGSWSRNA